MSKLSRRALVASASSLPALAIPAASLAAPADPRDRQAVVARAEQMVEILRDRFVCAGWHEQFDTNRAAAFLGRSGKRTITPTTVMRRGSSSTRG